MAATCSDVNPVDVQRCTAAATIGASGCCVRIPADGTAAWKPAACACTPGSGVPTSQTSKPLTTQYGSPPRSAIPMVSTSSEETTSDVVRTSNCPAAREPMV